MSGTKTTKKRFNTQIASETYKGEENTQNSKTMPGLHIDPRVILENHVRGINPINGAVINNQHYYGDAVLPYRKDLTYEELQLRKNALLEQQANLLETLTSTKGTPTADSISSDSTEVPTTTTSSVE